MLAMIEINLLPPQYRAVDRTPPAVFLSLIGGIVLLGGAIIMLGVMMKKVTTVGEVLEEKKRVAAEKERAANDVRRLEGDIQDAQGRVDAVIRISLSKIPWFIKLDQLSRLIPQGDIWIDKLEVVEGKKGVAAELKLTCNARGTSLEKVTSFKETLRTDTNFFYHFADVVVPEVNPRMVDKKYAEPVVLTFNMRLPLKLDLVPTGAPRPAAAPAR